MSGKNLDEINKYVLEEYEKLRNQFIELEQENLTSISWEKKINKIWDKSRFDSYGIISAIKYKKIFILNQIFEVVNVTDTWLELIGGPKGFEIEVKYNNHHGSFKT